MNFKQMLEITRSNVCITETPMTMSLKQQVLQTTKDAVTKTVVGAIPYGDLLATIFSAAKEFSNISKDPKVQLNAILKAMSMDDSQKQSAMKKFDINDRLYDALSKSAHASIAELMLKHLPFYGSIDAIPPNFGNDMAKKYLAKLTSKI